jgi:hypothetical protein
MLLGQAGIEGSRDHAPGLMPKLFNLGEGRFPRRTGLAKPMLGQHRDQFPELLFFLRRQLQVSISSILAHGSFLSKGSSLSSPKTNLLRAPQNRQPEF